MQSDSRALTVIVFLLLAVVAGLGVHVQRLNRELNAAKDDVQAMRVAHDKAYEAARVHMAANAELREQIVKEQLASATLP